jgi:hypothetical protein
MELDSDLKRSGGIRIMRVNVWTSSSNSSSIFPSRFLRLLGAREFEELLRERLRLSADTKTSMSMQLLSVDSW